MGQERYEFPKEFLWGTATSSHQVEGNNTNNNWYIWEGTPGKVEGDAKAGLACDWWNGRWREDLQNAVADGQNAHRLSIEWSRVEPRPSEWDEAALEHYREMIRGIIALGLKPMITLHHFTDPIWIYEKGGWENDETPDLFARYCEKTVNALHDLTDLWVTINEPCVYTFGGYMTGDFPPGKQDTFTAFHVLRNMVRGHAQAYHIIHRIQPTAMVGIAKNFRTLTPARKWFLPDRWIRNFSSQSFNDSFVNALTNGKFKFALWKETIPEAANTQDYVGINYYTRDLVKFKLFDVKNVFQERFFDPKSPVSETGFIANEPEGLYEALQWARKYKLPIYITENGVEDSKDSLRPLYLVSHLFQVWKAIQDGMDIRGYFHWSQVDNFEWERAWTQRFGLWELDVETQERIRRPSVDLYKEICINNAIPREMLNKYILGDVEE